MGPLIKANLIIAGICMSLAFLHLAICIRRPELKAYFFRRYVILHGRKCIFRNRDVSRSFYQRVSVRFQDAGHLPGHFMDEFCLVC